MKTVKDLQNQAREMYADASTIINGHHPWNTVAEQIELQYMSDMKVAEEMYDLAVKRPELMTALKDSTNYQVNFIMGLDIDNLDIPQVAANFRSLLKEHKGEPRAATLTEGALLTDCKAI